MKRKVLNRIIMRFRPISVLMVLFVFVLNSVVAISVLTPTRYQAAVGEIAPHTIFASRTIEDETTTAALRAAARSGVAVVYKTDAAYAGELIAGADSFFDALDALRADAQTIRSAYYSESGAAEGSSTTTTLTAQQWQALIPEADLLEKLHALPIALTDTAVGYAVLAADAADLTRLRDTVHAQLEKQLLSGITEDALDGVRATISRELQVTSIPVLLKSLGETVYDHYFMATSLEDTAETTRAREKASANVKPVYIARGTSVVEAGQPVTEEQMRILRALDLVRGENENRWFEVGVAGYLLLLYLCFIAYLLNFEKAIFADRKQMLLLTIVLAITTLLEWLCYALEPRISPALFAAILAALLISPRMGQAVNVLTALSLGFLAGGSGDNLLGSDALLSVAVIIVTGQFTIMIARKNTKRSSLIMAGAVGGLFGALTVLMGAAMLGMSWRDIVVFIGCAFCGSLLLSVFSVGTMSLWENAFDIVTVPRLHELLNANHPLLKKMMTAAPGTYHHSMMAAALAEGAAEAIGANAMLARAGATYHDVGKLRCPLYFSENQNGVNVHDTLPPEESARIIIGHQQDAEPLLARYKIPAAIRQIAYEHHGTTLVAYFYYKAKKEAGGAQISEAPYRYPAHVPSTKESAIVMLADSCEAAVRSLGDAVTREEVADMVHKIIKGKLDDGQLAQCPLTFAELTRIEKSFNTTFNGLLHERIRYPGSEEAEL